SLFVFAFCFAKNDAFFKISRCVHEYASLLATILEARWRHWAYGTEGEVAAGEQTLQVCS
ncbi:MAG TPA: hypothetical protein PL112_21910, partial [Candidatus Obscuribacter sp.]|nr:hypothetical protein [Candidatus Obscuribacter sp.]